MLEAFPKVIGKSGTLPSGSQPEGDGPSKLILGLTNAKSEQRKNYATFSR
jgi:hypothetical protein